MEYYLLIFNLKSLRWKHVTGMDKGTLTVYDLEKGSQGGETQTIPSQRSEHPKPLPTQSNNDVSSPPTYNEAIHIWLKASCLLWTWKTIWGNQFLIASQKISQLSAKFSLFILVYKFPGKARLEILEGFWSSVYLSCRSNKQQAPWWTGKGKAVSDHNQVTAYFANTKLRLFSLYDLLFFDTFTLWSHLFCIFQNEATHPSDAFFPLALVLTTFFIWNCHLGFQFDQSHLDW